MEKKERMEEMEEQTVIEVKGLTKQYKKQTAVKDAGFSIKRGSICGLIGPNGAGKTTIMKMLGGLVIPTAGSISLYGCRREAEQAKARERMSFMIEIPYAKLDLTAWQNLEKQRIQKGIPNKGRMEEVMDMVGLSDVGNKKLKEYSLGMKQRFGIANALLSKPETMILDEPVNGLDPGGIVEIREMLMKLNREEDITILISSHILSELALLCSEYLFIAEGKIIRQLTNEELKRECRSYLSVNTDNNNLALAVLREKLGIADYEVEEDGSLRLYEYLENIAAVSRTLYENGVLPLGLSTGGDTLEQYYISMIGGAAHVEHH